VHHRAPSPLSSRTLFVILAILSSLFIVGACGGGAWAHVVVRTDTSSSADCASKCLKKAAGKPRYKCLTKCPGSREVKAKSCSEAAAEISGAFQCESSK